MENVLHCTNISENKRLLYRNHFYFFRLLVTDLVRGNTIQNSRYSDKLPILSRIIYPRLKGLYMYTAQFDSLTDEMSLNICLICNIPLLTFEILTC